MPLAHQCSVIDHSFSLEMRLAALLSVLGFCLAYVAANSFEDHHAPYGFYHPYYFHPYYSPNPVRIDALRTLALGMGGGFTAALPRPSVTMIRIVTTTVTCSLSVTKKCAARQASEMPSEILEQPARPGRPADRDEEVDDTTEQFPIAPSTVQEVEATQLPAREARAADPQWLIPPKFDYRAHEIEAAFHSDPYNLPVVVPFNRRYYVPAQQRQFGFITNLFTITKMGTSFTVKTSTLVPSCSAAGKLPQCPNGQ